MASLDFTAGKDEVLNLILARGRTTEQSGCCSSHRD